MKKVLEDDVCEGLLRNGRWQEALESLEKKVGEIKEPDGLCALAKQIAGIYSDYAHNYQRAASFALLAGQCAIRSGRMSQAVALLHWLKSCPGAHVQAQELRTWINETFSRPIAKKKYNDDDLPPPTPYQVLDAFVAFDRTEVDEIARKQWTESSLKRTTFFSDLRKEEVDVLTQAAHIRELAAGTILFREGDSPTAFYIVVDGTMNLSSSLGWQKTFSEGDFFGEVALIGQRNRTATLSTETGATLLELTGEKLAECCRVVPSLEQSILDFYERRLFLHIAARSSLFSQIKMTELDEIFDYFTSIYTPAEHRLFVEGEPSDRFFFLCRGEVIVERSGQKVSTLGPGQFFGEMGLLNHKSRTASVITHTDCHILECHDELFVELLQRFPILKNRLKKEAVNRFLDLVVSEEAIID